jgi:hypothetical protein
MIAEIFILASVIPATLGPLFYAFSGPWWREHIGRALMIAWTGLGLLIDWAALFVLFGDDFPGRALARNVVFFFLAVGLWYKFIALVLLRRQARREELQA